ncbi:class I SAM-dependent methyltransferase [Streptomyces qinzhouensis]|uniref:Class I SAM-dependent methyltransferase n=1 Tax=Streptomyces qinzhouensis TaxID=2599401 RepID=A0A5B8JGP7_9ACTN|nr:class I SAM-dependent methyltransferase [Streptomyces qinzhouensis]QDY76920.1 class I SAM-dependent methyltransferase [Streptomyces qinzhouensis]
MSLETYWNRYAENPITIEESMGNGFGWTQYPGHGPGEELLGQPTRVLELGCGTGDSLAHLTRKGIEGVGVDLSSRQVEYAKERWGHQPGTRFVCADALEFLTDAPDEFDAVYSNWGALWFSDPRAWAPAVRARLTDRGLLVFSCAPPVEGCYGAQGMYGNGFRGEVTPVLRWAYPPETWQEILHEVGFAEVYAKIFEAPDPRNLGTLIVQAHVM